MQNLFEEALTFVIDAPNQKAVFSEVSQQLRQLKAVKENFLENLMLREQNFPTGIDLSVVDSQLPNVAIPHTEVAFVNTTKIIPVKLLHPIDFHNMIAPDKKLTVDFLFMILNDQPNDQANLLAQIMDFLTKTPPDILADFFNLKDTKQIYQFIEENFTKNEEEK